jgi:hypothetical protein
MSFVPNDGSAYVAFDDHFKTILARDLAGMLLGDYDGHGTYRSIFHHATDPTLIVKVENKTGSFSNVQEWDVWQRVKLTKLARWFAPCVQISGAGTVLIQRKCELVTARQLPKKVPAFFTDLKAENWGLLNGRAVCFDYGCNLLMERGMTERLRIARWD